MLVGEGTDQCSRGGCGPRNMETQHGKGVRSANWWNPENNQVLPSVRSPGSFAAGSPPLRLNLSFQTQPKNLLAVFNAALQLGLLEFLFSSFCVHAGWNGERLLRQGAFSQRREFHELANPRLRIRVPEFVAEIGNRNWPAGNDFQLHRCAGAQLGEPRKI